MRELRNGDRVTYSVIPFRAFGIVTDARDRHGEVEVVWDRTTLPMPHAIDRLVIIQPDVELLGETKKPRRPR